MSRNIVNVPASVRNRLLNISIETKRPFIEVLQHFAIERFLYRLSVSKHASLFFLKGALMFKAWNTLDHRPTMDIDLLGKIDNAIPSLEKIFKDVCRQAVSVEDGISFLPESITGAAIQSDALYEGARIEFRGELHKAIIPMQIDIGFGDVIFPNPAPISYPTLLDLPAPKLHGYTPESVIAEKFEAMVKRGLQNSRMKDFFDIWFLSKQFTFTAHALSSAIRSTFNQRGTFLETNPECFSESFSKDATKNSQWQAFLRKNRLESIPLAEVIAEISIFLTPLINLIVKDESSDKTWQPHQRWMQ